MLAQLEYGLDNFLLIVLLTDKYVLVPDGTETPSFSIDDGVVLLCTTTYIPFEIVAESTEGSPFSIKKKGLIKNK